MAAMASRTWQISQATCTAETSTTEEISCHDTQAQAWMRAPMNWMISTTHGFPVLPFTEKHSGCPFFRLSAAFLDEVYFRL
jgi:hypothetical protein